MKRHIPIGAPGRKRDAAAKKGRGGRKFDPRTSPDRAGDDWLADKEFTTDAPASSAHRGAAKAGSRKVGGQKGPGGKGAARKGAGGKGGVRAGTALQETRTSPPVVEVAPLTAEKASAAVSRAAATQSRTDVLSLFAITAPGLEAITAAELRALGIGPLVIEPGGVGFTGTLDDVYRANLWLRTASRVVIRFASFHASEFHELERRAKRVPWDRYIGVPARARFRVTCRKSRLYHSDAVAERLAKTIEQSHGLAGGFAMAGADESPTGEDASGRDDAQLFIVRLVNDDVTISADTSGELLHRRGYRQAVLKAPLRETLAAAMLAGSGWDPATPLADPMCGSGTIAIEGAMLARGMAPGIDHVQRRSRQFAFMGWAGFDDHAWSDRISQALDAVRPSPPSVIIASDRDAGAIAAAQANAERAGVASDIEMRQGSVSALELPPGPGSIVSNPPYGVRVGETPALRNLYAQLGKVVRDRGHGWTLALLTADRALERQVGIGFAEVFRVSNGGIPVRLVRGVVR